MRTNVHWAMKSQQLFTEASTIVRRNNIDWESIWTWTGSVARFVCIADKNMNILTDNRIDTYLNYEK